MSRRTELLEGESGVALVAALLAVLILGGISVVFVSMTTTTSRVTAVSRDAEIALHVAEAGVDELIARINWDEDHVVDPDEHEVDLDGMSEAQQREWALQAVLDDDDLAPLRSGTSGDSFGIRPVHPDDGPYDLVFGVGLVPSRDDPARVRVIRVRYDRAFFQPKHGLLGCGSIEVAGNARITGDLGHVHANGSVDFDGSSYLIEGRLSAGSVTGDSSKAGVVEVPSVEEVCPRVRALDFYGRANEPYTCYEGSACADTPPDGKDGRKVRWWDLCSDGTARRGGSSPCDGEIVFDQAKKSAANHMGWSYQANRNEWSTQSLRSGIYYVHEARASISGSGTGTVSVLVGADGSDAGETGNLEWKGSSKMDAALDGLTLVTDRDLDFQGSSSGGGSEIEGLIAVGEQADLGGTARIHGSVYVRDAPHTTNSPVPKTRVRGNFEINYNRELDVPMIGTIRIVAWNELR